MARFVIRFSLGCGALLAASIALADGRDGTAAAQSPETPTRIDEFVYRELSPAPLRLFVFKPSNWEEGDRRPAFIWFFGGGWVGGNPYDSAGWAQWASDLGMVGVAPDYRVKSRFGTSPLEAVADARAVMRWVEDHADELGIDARRIAVGGVSAGGHLALWTAIGPAPPGSSQEESPKIKPAALILVSAGSDTSDEREPQRKLFGKYGLALSPLQHLDAKMPPMLVFHGDADEVVPYWKSVALRDKLIATGNTCELVTIPNGPHNYSWKFKEWGPKTMALALKFLTDQGVVSGNPDSKPQ